MSSRITPLLTYLTERRDAAAQYEKDCDFFDAPRAAARAQGQHDAFLEACAFVHEYFKAELAAEAEANR